MSALGCTPSSKSNATKDFINIIYRQMVSGPAFCFTLLRVLLGLNKVSEIHRHALQAVYLLNPINKAKTTYDYEWIMTFFCSLPYFFEE